MDIRVDQIAIHLLYLRMGMTDVKKAPQCVVDAASLANYYNAN